MERYKHLSKEDIIYAYNSSGDCEKCTLKNVKGAKCAYIGDCVNKITNWLNEEIIIKPRIAMINTVEELIQAEKDFETHCIGNSCDNCKYNASNARYKNCFTVWLAEELIEEAKTGETEK